MSILNNFSYQPKIFFVYEFDYHPDIISSKLDLKPLKIGVKGEKYFVGHKKQVTKTHEYNFWTFEHKNVLNQYIGDFIGKFIDEIIISRLDTIKNISQDGKVQLRIVQYFYNGCNPGIYLKREYIKILSEINCSIDIDLYCLNEKE